MRTSTIVFLFIVLFSLLFGIGYLGYRITEQFKPVIIENLIDIGMIEKNNDLDANLVTNVTKIIANPNTQQPQFEFVSATEYTKGDGTGSTIVKLIDWKGDRLNTTCWETILYPNKTTYTDWATMTQHWDYGNYYMNFIVPEPLGVYDQEVRCYVGSKNISIGKGFHVSNISNNVNVKVDNLKQDIMTVVE